MSDLLPGDAAPIPQRLPAVPFRKAAPDPAAQARRGVGRWLRRLGNIGAALTTGLRDLARRRFESRDGEAEDGKAGGIDLGLGRALLHRAMRWIAALQDRFAVEARAARVAMDPPERLSSPVDPAIAALAAELRAIRGPRPAPYPGAPRDDCIDGKPVAEVVAQICADLDAAADLLGEDWARRRIAAIAEAARAMLGEPEAALLPPPAIPGRAPGEKPAAAISLVAVPIGAPDTG